MMSVTTRQPDLVLRLDRWLRPLFMSRAAERLFGLEPARYVGRSLADMGLPEAVRDAARCAATLALKTGQEQLCGFSLARPAQTRHYSAKAVPERDRDERIASVLMLIFDVTGRARQQPTPTDSSDQLLAVVSHELRCPLNAIQSWSEVLASQIEAEDISNNAVALRALQGIQRAVRQQERLINDLRDARNLIAGRLQIARRPLALRGPIEAAIGSVRPLLRAKQLSFSAQLERADELVDGDADRLEQIVWNLLTNAIKFTPAGGEVRLTLQRKGEMLALRVLDSGRGISADFLPHIYDWFERAEQTRAGGLGLGLAVARHLCELHGGSIRAESAGAGCGTCFTVTLPLSKSAMRLDERRESLVA